MDTPHRNLNALVAKIVGAVLVLVGLLGFVVNETLLIFGVNTLHNLVHLLTGAALLAAGFINDGEYARPANLTLGAIYLLVAVLGYAGILVPDLLNTRADTVPHADNTLHLLLGIALIGAAFAARHEATHPVTRA